jgi:hypothetical protein
MEEKNEATFEDSSMLRYQTTQERIYWRRRGGGGIPSK